MKHKSPPVIRDQDLIYSLVKQETLSTVEKKTMFHLMQANYDDIDEQMFADDLSNKTYVGLIRGHEDEIRGFTTFVINPNQCAGEQYNILFSGDTIIDPKYWGTQVLTKGWCYSVGKIVASDLSKPWYWYLMSKGHRTYMYLPLFFDSYYPSIEPSIDDLKYQHIANEVSLRLFGDKWSQEKGVIQFIKPHGKLNEIHTKKSYKKSKSSIVQFYLKKNPKFYEGDELICLAKLEPENFKRMAKEYIVLGLENPSLEL